MNHRMKLFFTGYGWIPTSAPVRLNLAFWIAAGVFIGLMIFLLAGCAQPSRNSKTQKAAAALAEEESAVVTPTAGPAGVMASSFQSAVLVLTNQPRFVLVEFHDELGNAVNRHVHDQEADGQSLMLTGGYTAEVIEPYTLTNSATMHARPYHYGMITNAP